MCFMFTQFYIFNNFPFLFQLLSNNFLNDKLTLIFILERIFIKGICSKIRLISICMWLYLIEISLIFNLNSDGYNRWIGYSLHGINIFTLYYFLLVSFIFTIIRKMSNIKWKKNMMLSMVCQHLLQIIEIIYESRK